MTHRSLCALVAFALLLAAAPAAAQAPVAPGYRSPYAPITPTACPDGADFQAQGNRGPGCYQTFTQHHQRGALFWPGFAGFVAGYALSAVFGYFNLTTEDGDDGLHLFGTSLIPIVGPFIGLAWEDHEEDIAFSSAMGGLQAIGMTLMILSHVFAEEITSSRRVAFTGNGVYGTF